MGAGKTTAIRSLSTIDVVSTEAANTDRATADKDTTTVALDYGEIDLGPDDKVRLYGVPGQSRFDFMWEILQQRAMGMILLVNADADSVESLVGEHLAAFRDLTERGGIAIGVTRTDVEISSSVIAAIQTATERAIPERPVPVFTVDARDPAQMQVLLMALVADIDSRRDLAEGARG